MYVSSPHFLRWHHLEIPPCVFTDYRIIRSPAKIILVPIRGLTDIEDGFRHNSTYVSTEWPVRASPSLYPLRFVPVVVLSLPVRVTPGT